MLIKNLFILDDDIITTHLMKEIIKDLTFVSDFHIENNGWQAMEYLHLASKQNSFPDLLLIDLKMPEMDGFEFIEHYEETFFASHPESALMVITSSVSEKDRQKAMQYTSVTRFLLKPLTEKTLEDIAGQNYHS
jgi:CheY-like chemotaxis protein